MGDVEGTSGGAGGEGDEAEWTVVVELDGGCVGSTAIFRDGEVEGG